MVDKIYLIEYDVSEPGYFDETAVSCEILASSKDEAMKIFKEEISEGCAGSVVKFKEIYELKNPSRLNAEKPFLLSNKEPNWNI